MAKRRKADVSRRIEQLVREGYPDGHGQAGAIAYREARENPVRIAFVHLNAGSDRNGNPRRIFVAFDEAGRIVGTVDEEYRGMAALYELARSLGVTFPRTALPPQFETTPSQYRELKQWTAR
jgi:hypothetical protein